MKNFIISELRKCSSIPGKQKTWISELSDAQLYEIYKRLLNGEKCRSIAKYIQKAWRIKPNSTVHSVAQGIAKFKRRIHLLLDESKSEDLKKQYIQTNSDTQIGSLEGNELIALNLRKRIQQIIKDEHESGVKYPYLARDVQALTSFQKIIEKQKEWHLKHPNDDPIKVMENKAKDRKIEHLFKNFMGGTSKDHQDRIINALEKFLELCDEKSVSIDSIR